MMMTVARALTLCSFSLMLFLGNSGCTDPIGHDPQFPGEYDVRAVDHFAEAQMAAGARHDATLHDFHFDGDVLNELGREKLDLIMTDAAGERTVIYVDLPDPDATPAVAEGAADRNRPQIDAVSRYLVDAGYPEDRFETRAGPNVTTSSSAAASLARMKRIDSLGGSSAPRDNGTYPGFNGARDNMNGDR